ARGFTRRAAYEVRARDQPQDREGPRPDDPARGARAGRRSDPMTRRRAFVAGSLILLTAQAQPATKVWRIGVLSGSSSSDPIVHPAFLKALRDLGYVLDQNLILEERYADG